MIDIHTHVLPGIDDGSKSVDESLAMLEEFKRQGTIKCFATSHCKLHKDASLEEFLQKRNDAFKLLRPHLSESVHPEIMLGAEVYLDHDISVIDGIEKLCVENTPYMLLELPLRRVTKSAADWLYSLTLRGIKPILAHVERYPNFLELAQDLSEIGVLCQINATEFLFFSGRRKIKKLLSLRDDYIIASDTHGMNGRVCNLKKAYEKASKMRGVYADILFSNADKLFETTEKKLI